MRILVCIDNFRIGGRETFLSGYLGALRGHGVTAALLAARIADGAAGLDRFDVATACASDDGAVATWRNWLERGGATIRERRPDMIWAQHFELLPAWVLAMRHGIPLLTTFHGPLTGAGRPNRLLDALGMTLAASRGGFVSAVSPEAAASIFGDGADPSQARVIPNAVEWPARERSSRDVTAIRRIGCLTRTSKLGHLRAAARLFARCRKRCGACELTVAGGILPGQAKARDGWLARAGDAGRQLGFKWALDQGPGFVAMLPRIRMIGSVSDPMGLIASQDAVFGMGRVVLEALAGGKPAVLIGYDHAVDVIDGANFDGFAWRNFSGRAEAPGDPEVIAGRLAKAASLEPLREEQVARFSLDVQAPILREWLDGICRGDSRSGGNCELADELAAVILRGGGEDELFETGCDALTGGERRMLYRFSAG